MAQHQPSLPARKALVGQLYAAARMKNGQCKGRAEHLVPHQAAHFEPVEERLAFIVLVVMEQQQ
jgi:hypothetical protein